MNAWLRGAAMALTLIASLFTAACGGVASSGTSNVSGVATPSSVSVVTATNAE